MLLPALVLGSADVGVRAFFFLPPSRATGAFFLFGADDDGLPFRGPLAIAGVGPGVDLASVTSSWILMAGCVGLGSPVRGSMYGSDASNLMVLVCGCET